MAKSGLERVADLGHAAKALYDIIKAGLKGGWQAAAMAALKHYWPQILTAALILILLPAIIVCCLPAVMLGFGGSSEQSRIDAYQPYYDRYEDYRLGQLEDIRADQLQQLHTWFSLADPDMTKEQHHILDSVLLETYREFGITQDNSSLTDKNGKSKPMPDLTHLLLRVKAIPELKSTSLTLERLINMGFGRQTNVQLSSKFIVFDTSKMPKEWNALGIFTATRFVKDTISISRVQRKVVMMDEGWKIAGEKSNDEAADFVIDLVKTIRGYGGIFVSATQNLIDYFALQEGRFGKSLLGNSRIKILLQMEEAEAFEIKEKLGLSEDEVLQIIRSGRGQGLLCAGPNRIGIEIRSTQREFDILTTSHADLIKRKK